MQDCFTNESTTQASECLRHLLARAKTEAILLYDDLCRLVQVLVDRKLYLDAAKVSYVHLEQGCYS